MVGDRWQGKPAEVSVISGRTVTCDKRVEKNLQVLLLHLISSASVFSSDPVVTDYRQYGYCAVLRQPRRPDEMGATYRTCRSAER